MDTRFFALEGRDNESFAEGSEPKQATELSRPSWYLNIYLDIISE
jgi:hypothetical protein